MVAVLAVTGAIGWFWSWQMWNVYYDDGLHRLPDSAIGRIYVENMHGVPLYTTSREHFLLHGVSALSIGVCVLACLIQWAQNRWLKQTGPK